MIVAFYAVRESPSKLIGKVWLNSEGEIETSGGGWIEELASESIELPDGELVDPKDGEAFLDALLHSYQGSALSAVKEQLYA